MTATPKTITTADLASALDTDPRTLRKFLRATQEGVGKGKRYALPGNATALKKFGKDFAAWSKAQETARKERAEAIVMADDDATAEALAENEALDAGDPEGPSDDELDDITAELED